MKQPWVATAFRITYWFYAFMKMTACDSWSCRGRTNGALLVDRVKTQASPQIVNYIDTQDLCVTHFASQYQ